ncbi:MAG TPA: ferritin-like domain-containing protein [Gemmatimonadaceae bacterium]|nr:ferritin-like domain-containing protein [Gemmatimonadaceae bacterium]
MPIELDSLEKLYLEELKDLYSAETQLIEAIPKMVKAAKSPRLKAAFRTHLAQTKEQKRRLERICKAMGKSPKGKKCEGMEGLIKEAKGLIKEKPDRDVLDAGLISAAQHVEHYEMAGYGTVRTYAQLLGYKGASRILQQTLNEEGKTDHLLTRLALTINVAAED